MIIRMSLPRAAIVLTAGMACWAGSAMAAPLPSYPVNSAALFETVMAGRAPLAEAAIDPDLTRDLQRQVVAYPTTAAAGTVVIDTAQTYLYYVLGNGRAIRYGIGVGRVGFT